jgi:hypothetical protein
MLVAAAVGQEDALQLQRSQRTVSISLSGITLSDASSSCVNQPDPPAVAALAIRTAAPDAATPVRQ